MFAEKDSAMKPILAAMTGVWLCLSALPANAEFSLFIEHAKSGSAKIFRKDGRWKVFKLEQSDYPDLLVLQITDLNARDIDRIVFTRAGAFPCTVRIKPADKLAYCRTPGKPSRF